MIQSSELRLGNKLFNPFDKVVEVAEIKKDSIGLVDGDGGYLSSFEPIPLTSGMLTHLRFNEKWPGLFTKQLDDKISISIVIDKTVRHVGIKNTAGYIEINEIQSLHQLQNLIFALSGKYLEITL